MASFLRSWLIVAVLSAGASGCATRAKDLVTLNYGWPEQASMRVTHTVDMRTDREGRTKAQRRFTMTLGPVDEEGQRRLAIRDVEIIESMLPTFIRPRSPAIIDAQGDFQGMDPVEDDLNPLSLDVFPPNPEKKAQMTRNLIAGLEQDLRDKWNQWVGSWHGARLKPGKLEVVSSTIEVGIGRKTYEEVPAEDRQQLDVGVPCSDAEPEPRCARLHVVREPVGQTDDTKGPYARLELELVTDPSTLLPYSSRLIRMDRVNWSTKGGEPHFHESVHVEQHTFLHGMDTTAGPMARVSALQPIPTSLK
ncbi:hypothetical protein [Corallococcus terminator]|uniref:Lipoprotein n=1 Tax=Corallococcus terminator TaxID=2316733 RepID=A0A3A8I3J9_9BACT|nr:hypothetical protein [Corallococcus terminator]RKG77725.1 hypothetical protein D7V88_30685 [Corallococcus terminator]